MVTISDSSGYGVAALIIAAILIHASFQLAISVLTLLSGHTFGRESSYLRALKLGLFYIIGVLTMIVLLGTALLYLVANLHMSLHTLWLIASLLGIVTGVAVLLFYYRMGSRLLWLPKSFAVYLQARSAKTKSPTEAFTLGMATGIAELPFILAPMLIMVLLMISVTGPASLGIYPSYALLTCAPLVLVLSLTTVGRPVSHFQRWREANKGFLQFSSGALLLATSGYIFVMYYLQSGNL